MVQKKITKRHSQRRHFVDAAIHPPGGDRGQRSNPHLRLVIYEVANGALYLTVSQVGRLLGVAQQTVRNQMSRGEFPLRSIKLGRRRLFPVEDVVEFANREANS